MNNLDLEKLMHGAVSIKRQDGYCIARRCTDEQVENLSWNKFFQDRSRCGASITLELTTNAERIAFAYKFFLRTGVKSTFEVYTNGFLTHMVKDCELPDVGTLEFALDKGDKHIEIYIPNYSEIGVKDFDVGEGVYAPVHEKKLKVLFLGDSITQGGGPERSGQTYVNVVKRALNCEIVNQGIGGYYCDKNSVCALPFVPDKVIVAYGTNHSCFSETEHKKAIGEYFKSLVNGYKEIPILLILPPYDGWGDFQEQKRFYKRIKEDFLQTASLYPRIKIVNAYDMIPHFSDYYMDDFRHPSALGMEVYGNNLLKAMKEIGF